METKLESPVVINHNGKAIYFVSKSEGLNDQGKPLSDSYHYNVLDLKIESENDDLDWGGYSQLEFPEQVSVAGMNMMRIEKPLVTQGLFQVLSDQKYIYICRATHESIYINRYLLVEVPNLEISGATKYELQPAWELRYLRSGRPDTPLSDKDTQNFVDLEGKPFIEPIYELPLGYNQEPLDYTSSFFCANFTPTNTSGVTRWQFFISKVDSGSLLGYSIERSETGWFNFAKNQINFADSIIDPDQVFKLTIEVNEDLQDLKINGPSGGAVYTKQEPITTKDSDVLKLQQGYRFMLAIEVINTLDPDSTSCLSILDFAITHDGTLSNPELSEGKLQVGEVKPAEYTLHFDGVSSIEIAGDPIKLGPAFTQQVWLNSKVSDLGDRLIMGSSDSKLEEGQLPPSIWITDKFKIKLGFGDGTNKLLSATSLDNVININSWNNVIATYKSGIYRLWINGAEVVLEQHDFGNKVPTETALNSLGGQKESLANLVGDMDEVRIWNNAEDGLASALEYLYKEIPSEIALEMTNLEGYWRLDEGSGITTKTRAKIENRNGKLFGPQWTPATAPLKADKAPIEYLDLNGLSTYAGVIIPNKDSYQEFGAIKTKSRPQLLSSADGFIHLYYQGLNDEFLVAQYDTSNARAYYGIPWQSITTDPNQNQTGSLIFSTRQTGTIMNKAKITFSKNSDNELVDILLDDGKGLNENWTGLPNDIAYILKVLEGKSVNQPADSGLIIGEKIFFDYSKKRNCNFNKIGDPSLNGCLQFVSRNTEKFVMSEISVTPDAGNNELTDPTCSVKLEINYTDNPNDGSFYKTLKNVPIEVSSFMDTINGASTSYDYSSPNNANQEETKFYEIPSDNDTLMAVIPDPKVSGMNMKIENSTINGGDPDLCTVIITMNETSTGDSTEATWENISRVSEDFVTAIKSGTEDKQPEIAALIQFFDISGKAHVYNSTVDVAANLYAACSFLDVFGLNLNGDVANFEATLEPIQAKNDGKDNTLGSPGSLFFGVSSTKLIDTGFPASIDFSNGNEVVSTLLQPGLDGGWFAESPRNCIEIFDAESGVEIPLDPILNSPLKIEGDMTMESWINATNSNSSGNADDINFPRIIHANLEDDFEGSKYLLGTTYSSALQFLNSNDDGPGAIEINDDTVEDRAKVLVNSNDYTVQLYLKADIDTPVDAPGRVYELKPSDPNLPTQKLSVKKGGELLFELIQDTTVTPYSLNYKLTKETGWVMLTLSRKGDTISTYVNNVVDIQIPIAGQITTNVHHSLTLGKNGQATALQMQLNQFAIWQKSKSDLEVKNGYNKPVSNDDDRLVLLLRMDDHRLITEVPNKALATEGLYNEKVSGKSGWEYPGVFSRAYASVRNTAIMSEDALIASGKWNHVAAIYNVSHGIEFSGEAYGNCGNESNLNINDGMSVSTNFILKNHTVGKNQVFFSKFGKNTTNQCYEFGLDSNAVPYLKVRLQGITNKAGDKVQELDLYKTVKGNRVINKDTPTSITATLELSSKSDGDQPDSQSITTVSMYLYINGEKSGEFEQKEMYGTISVNQSGTDVNVSRTKPNGNKDEQAFFQGKLSKLNFWNKPISANQVLLNYQSQEGQLTGEGLVSQWDFSTQQGRVAYDRKSENHMLLSSSDMWITYYDNATLKLLINGQQVSGLKIDPLAVNGYQLKQASLGHMLNEASKYRNSFLGEIDEIRIWSEARTLEQLTDNMERYLPVSEDNLAGYWRFDVGSGTIVSDQTGSGNNAVFAAKEGSELPIWVPSKAPISNESKVVLNALGGLQTGFLAKISGAPAIIEYPDSQFNANGDLFGVYKRAYIYKGSAGNIQRVTGYKVGDLSQIYLGQVQTKPSIIGFVEGAPPLPSENLTRPYYTDPTAYTDYGGIASVELSDVENTTVSLSSSKEDGSNLAFGIKGGLAIKSEPEVPLLGIHLADVEFKIGPAAEIKWSTSETNATGAAYGISKSTSNKMSSGGNWDAEDSKITGLSGERRYVPSNNGYALVRSSTADMYAQYLKSTGAMVGFQMMPNLDIPPDTNIITFPINPAYTKNGTLDGKVGLLNDPDPAYQNANLQRGSYFKPIEAYSLKKKVERKEQELLTYYNQFDAVERGKAQQNDLSSVIANNPIRGLNENKTRADLVNTYVWTSARGLYAEQEGATSMRQESHSGVYNFEWSLGFDTSGQFLYGPGVLGGFYFEASLMGGTQWTVTVQKDKTEEDAFELNVEAAADGFLRKYNGDADNPGFSANLVPGKVEAYRFMSYYLSPEENNFDDFFSKVVDPVWYATSNDQRAAALREAEANPNPAWRIMHRVTYVSRIPPEFEAFPLDSQAPEIAIPDNIGGNKFLIDLITSELEEKERTPLNIGETVRHVIMEDLKETIPWWGEFLKDAEIENSKEQLTLSTFITDVIAYMIQYYETLEATN